MSITCKVLFAFCSNLAEVNFSLCMTCLPSFKEFSWIFTVLRQFQNILQMSASALQANPSPTCKVVNVSPTLGIVLILAARTVFSSGIVPWMNKNLGFIGPASARPIQDHTIYWWDGPQTTPEAIPGIDFKCGALPHPIWTIVHLSEDLSFSGLSKLHQDLQIGFGIDCGWALIVILKPEMSDYPIVQYCNPCCLL